MTFASSASIPSLSATLATSEGAYRPPSRFIPERGMVLMCDFQGMRTREIGHKTRPVVVLSPRADNDITVTVMPFTRSAQLPGPTNILIPADRYVFFTPSTPCWAVGSCVHDVEHSRLGGIFVHGRRQAPFLQPDDIERILAAARWRLRHPIEDASVAKTN